MSNSCHLLLLVCTQAFALSCASRPALTPARPALSNAPHWLADSELHAAVREPAGSSANNPYAPTRSLGAALYSWQRETRAACAPEPLAASERSSAPGVFAAIAERRPDSTSTAQPVSVDSVVLALRPAIHHCFSRWLEAKTDAQGSARFSLELDCAGEVQAISAVNQGVDESTLECLFSVVAPARFAPPVGGHATVHVPVVFKNTAH